MYLDVHYDRESGILICYVLFVKKKCGKLESDFHPFDVYRNYVMCDLFLTLFLYVEQILYSNRNICCKNSSVNNSPKSSSRSGNCILCLLVCNCPSC